jgi:hypothetical protein
MNKTFIEFLIKAKKSTYASVDGDGKKILDDGSKEFVFSEGGYIYRDRYFGSDPFGGEEIVFFNNKVIWVMNYYGYILDETISEKEITDFLKQALINVREEAPFRGPAEFNSGNYSYVSSAKGDVDSFVGSENIFLEKNKVYKLNFHGGMIG